MSVYSAEYWIDTPVGYVLREAAIHEAPREAREPEDRTTQRAARTRQAPP